MAGHQVFQSSQALLQPAILCHVTEHLHLLRYYSGRILFTLCRCTRQLAAVRFAVLLLTAGLMRVTSWPA